MNPLIKAYNESLKTLPTQSTFVKEYVKATMETEVGTLKQLTAKKEQLTTQATEKYKNLRSDMYKHNNEQWEKLKQAYSKEMGVDKKQADVVAKAWEQAWEAGHDCGIQSVCDNFDNLCEMLLLLPDVK